VPACLLSLLLHAIVLGAGGWLLASFHYNKGTTPTSSLQATLVPPLPALPAPELIGPDLPPDAPLPAPDIKTRQSSPSANRSSNKHAATAAAIASRQIAEHLLYPQEAIARGLEGEAQVLLFLDAAGNAVAARLERSSGHAILDDAAVLAAQTVRALPEGAPREVLLPVRFRLR
jgi:protein TonB